MEDLVESHRLSPGHDLLSAMATDDGPEGRMPTEQLGQHRASPAHCRTRNHREPDLQRRADPVAAPGRAPEAARGPRPGHPDGRGTAALRTARAFRSVPHRPRRYRRRRHDYPGRAPPSRCSWSQATATPPTSPTRTSSSRTGPTTNTSALAAASTSASAHPWPVWKPRSPSPNLPAGWRTRGLSPTRHPTGRAPSCADPRIFRSTSTASPGLATPEGAFRGRGKFTGPCPDEGAPSVRCRHTRHGVSRGHHPGTLRR